MILAIPKGHTVKMMILATPKGRREESFLSQSRVLPQSVPLRATAPLSGRDVDRQRPAGTRASQVFLICRTQNHTLLRDATHLEIKPFGSERSDTSSFKFQGLYYYIMRIYADS